jgi:hypothetical protein
MVRALAVVDAVRELMEENPILPVQSFKENKYPCLENDASLGSPVKAAGARPAMTRNGAARLATCPGAGVKDQHGTSACAPDANLASGSVRAWRGSVPWSVQRTMPFGPFRTSNTFATSNLPSIRRR